MSILSTVFGGGQKKTKSLRTPLMTQAEQFLGGQMNAPVPEFPTRQIAPMSEAESLAQDLVGEYGRTEPEGMETLRSYAQGGDFMARPEIQALIEEITKTGQQETNRVGRSLQLYGATGSSAGRDVLGRSVADTQRLILTSLLPYLEGTQNRQIGAARSLADLGESSMLSRLSALTTTGGLSRTLEQLQSDAEYAQAMQQINFPYETQSGIASMILNANMPIAVTGGSPSPFSQASPLIGALLGLL